MMRKIFNLIIILGTSIFLKAQTHKVYEPDSMFMEKHEKYDRISGLYGIDFKENLADGHWQYFSKKNSREGDYDNYYLEIEGNYKDSVRHGKFVYYKYPYAEKKRNIKKEVYKKMNYFNGLLDGYFCIFYWNDIKLREGRYSKGKKDGFFIDYYTNEDKGKIETILFYKNDTLQNWVRYNRRGYISSQGYGEGNMITGEYILNDSIGRISSKGFFNKGVINKYQIFSTNGIIEKEVKGEFYPHEKSKYIQDNYYVIGFTREKLKNGVIRKYENGNLKEEEYYEDGKLKKTAQIK